MYNNDSNTTTLTTTIFIGIIIFIISYKSNSTSPSENGHFVEETDTVDSVLFHHKCKISGLIYFVSFCKISLNNKKMY